MQGHTRSHALLALGYAGSIEVERPPYAAAVHSGQHFELPIEGWGMSRRIRAGRLVALVLATIFAVTAAAEGTERIVHGPANPNSLLPNTPSAIWMTATPSLSRPDCTYLVGATGKVQLTWLSCPSTLALLADLAIADAIMRAPGHQHNTVLTDVQSLPPGTTLFRTCLDLGDCSSGETLTLIGRKGNGFWEVRADYSITATSPDETTVANVLASEWKKSS